MGWKVVTTQAGQYNQVLRMCDEQYCEVFELLSYADGKVPLQFKDVQKRDKDKRPIPDEFEQVAVMTKTLDGKGTEQSHRDFAEDLGNKLIRSGPKKGESMRVGWMKRVPDKTPVGVYPKGTDFWSGIQVAPIWIPPGAPGGGPAGIQDPRRNHAPMLQHAVPETEEEAA